VAGATSPSVSPEVISTSRGAVGGAAGGGGGGIGLDGAAVTNSNESKTCLTGAGNGVANAKLPKGIAVVVVVSAVVVLLAVVVELPS
jgi:hypothetical protein